MGRCHSLLRGAVLIPFLLASLVVLSQEKNVDRNGGEERSHKEASEQLERDSWFRQGRAVQGQSAAELLNRALKQKAQLRHSATAQNSAQAYIQSGLAWSQLGPAPLAHPQYGYVSGRATSVAVDPTDSTGNTVYVGGAFGGLWKSTNAAVTNVGDVVWSQLLDNAPTLAVGAVAVKPDNGKVILVGTGETNASLDAYYGLGILRSEDGGATWTQISDAAPASGTTRVSFKGIGFSRIAFSSQNANLVVAAASLAPNSQGLTTCAGCTAGWGLYYSTDAGKTWAQAVLKDGTTTISPMGVNSVVFNPTDKQFYASVAYHGLYSSSDGITFIRLANQPAGAAMDTTACPASASLNCPIYRAEFAVRPDSTKGELYVWIIRGARDLGGSGLGIFQTRDSGTTWSALDVSGIDNCGDLNGCGAPLGIYDLALAAVPNGDGTDLYAGATNIFKCSITAQNPTCSANPFTNLTHVYGSSPIGVHPAQHGIAYPASNRNVVYFANDGGIYRWVNGAFGNLNGTIGSMAQLIGFSQTAEDESVLLAGTAGNGSASTNSSAAVDQGSNGLGWAVYHVEPYEIPAPLGNGGNTAINPANPNEWFVSGASTDGANTISRCDQGVNCKGLFTPVITQSTYGNDQTSTAPIPFLLDPSAPGKMILGTCRVWRGDSNPTGPWTTALSNNFTKGDASSCSLDRVLTALAAGGPKVDGVGSQVIFAGDQSGRVFVTVDANSGPASWKEITSKDANGKPVWSGFPISSIAIDTSDDSGLTAYFTVQGFNGTAGHVFKTTDGATWTNISGNPTNGGLPDAPANTVTLDPANSNIVYVGTDVGVFMTTDNGAHWAEYGPATGAGPLPNVPVTKLEAINTGTARKLRASTYGRGMWEISLASYKDFTQTVTPSLATVANGGTTTFRVAFQALGAFNADIKVACADLPNGVTCTYNPETVGSTASSSLVTVKLDATKVVTSTEPLAFKITGTAGDVIKTSVVKLNVTDFDMAATTTTGTVKAGSTASYSVGVSTSTGHIDAVALTCSSGLPDKATCTFSPSSIGPGATSILTIKTTAATTAKLDTPSFGSSGPLFAFWFGLPGMVLAGGAVSGKRKKGIFIALLVVVLVSAVGMTACGGGSNSTTPTPVAGTPAGTYTVTVTGTSGTLTHTTTVTLVVQ